EAHDTGARRRQYALHAPCPVRFLSGDDSGYSQRKSVQGAIRRYGADEYHAALFTLEDQLLQQRVRRSREAEIHYLGARIDSRSECQRQRKGIAARRQGGRLQRLASLEDP